MTNKEETDPTESQIVRASVLESHGWSSEPNRSQCKLRVQEMNSLVFLLPFIFLFVRATPFFILRDICFAVTLDPSHFAVRNGMNLLFKIGRILFFVAPRYPHYARVY